MLAGKPIGVICIRVIVDRFIEMRVAMKAMVLKSFGGPESFELCDVPKPEPHAGQVLVRVHATSINPLDYQF